MMKTVKKSGGSSIQKHIILHEKEHGENHGGSLILVKVPKIYSSSPRFKQFDTHKYTCACVAFHEYFPNDFNSISHWDTQKLSNVVESHLLQGPMLDGCSSRLIFRLTSTWRS